VSENGTYSENCNYIYNIHGENDDEPGDFAVMISAFLDKP
jgi:hypothetical protein